MQTHQWNTEVLLQRLWATFCVCYMEKTGGCWAHFRLLLVDTWQSCQRVRLVSTHLCQGHAKSKTLTFIMCQNTLMIWFSPWAADLRLVALGRALIGTERLFIYLFIRLFIYLFFSLHLNGTVIHFARSPGCFSSFTVNDGLILNKKKVKVLTK